jgi:hypothetical protein
MTKAVFAGCARSCAPFLNGVFANLEALGTTYDAFDRYTISISRFPARFDSVDEEFRMSISELNA